MKTSFKQDKDGRYLYTSRAGVTIELTHFPPLQASLAEQAARKEAVELFGAVSKPTYTTEMGEELEHDAKSLQDEATTDEERAAWAKWQETEAQINNHVGTRMIRFFLYYGVKASPKDDPEWEAEQKHFGIEIPADPIDRKIHYVQTRLIYHQEDIADIAKYLMTLAGVREELIDAATGSFRDPVAES